VLSTKSFQILSLFSESVATSPLALRWMCDSSRRGCARRTKHITWGERAIIECSRHVISFAACRHSVKLYAHAALVCRSQQK